MADPEPLGTFKVETPEGAVALLRHVWQLSDLAGPGGPRIYAPEPVRTALLTVLHELDDARAEARVLAAERLQAVQDLEAEREKHAATRRWLQAAEEELNRRPTRG